MKSNNLIGKTACSIALSITGCASNFQNNPNYTCQTNLGINGINTRIQTGKEEITLRIINSDNPNAEKPRKANNVSLGILYDEGNGCGKRVTRSPDGTIWIESVNMKNY